MEHGENLDAPLPREEAAPKLIDALTSSQKPVGGGIAQGDDDFGVYKSDLGREPFPTCCHFFLGGDAVSRRSAFHHIRDVHLLARDLRAFQDFGEELAGWADKGPTCLIFDLAGGFSDEHQFRGRAAFPKNDLAPGLRKGTTLTGKDAQPQVLQAWGEAGQRNAPPEKSGAGNGNRTRGLRLGTPTLYQLSYARVRF